MIYNFLLSFDRCIVFLVLIPAQAYITDNVKIEMEIEHVLPYGEHTFVEILHAIKKSSDDDIKEKHWNNGQAKTNMVGLHYWNTFPEIAKHLNEKFWKEALSMYIKRLKRIIAKSPPVTKKMLLYRGSEEDYYLKNNDFIFKEKGIVSCSISPNVFNVAHKLILTLLPKTKALFVAGLSVWGTKELEVILPPNTSYKLKYGKKTGNIYENESNAKNNVCGKAVKKIFVTNAVVI